MRLWLERPVVVEVRSAAIAALSEAWYTLRRRVRGFKVVVLLAVAGLILGPWKIGIAMAAIVAAIAALGVVRSAMSGSAHSIGRAVEFLGRGLGFGAVAFGVALAAASLPPAFTDALSLSSLIHQIEGRLSAGSASIPSSSTIPVWRPLHASANPDPPIGLIERVKQRLRGPLGNSAVQEKSRLPRRGNVTTVTKVVNLRAGPSMDSEILSKIRPPNALKVLSGPKNGWLMVQVQQRTGWMYKQAHLLVERPDPVTCRVRQDRGSVQVVRAPSASGAVLATLVPGGEYEFSRLHDDDAWVEIVGDAGATGWVLRSAVQLWGEDSRSR